MSRPPFRRSRYFQHGSLVVLAVLSALSAGTVAEPPGSTLPASTPARVDAFTEQRNAEHTRRFLEERVKRDPEDVTALNRLVSVNLQLMRATGRFSYLALAGIAARQSAAVLTDETNPGGLAALARVSFESHRFGEARDFARRMTVAAPARAEAFLILGDALLELGDIDGALAAWGEMERLGNGGLDLEVRRARVALLRGDLDQAREGFTRSVALARENDPPAPATVVWCLLQRGQLAFGRGDWDRAEADYREAQTIAPEHYAVLEHLAELRAAQSRLPEAVSLYEEVIRQTDRPEFMQALGDAYAFTGKTAEARPWHDRALAAYLKSVEDGNAHYYHHLAGFYADTRPEPAETLRWARRDFAIRQSVYAHDTIAWAFYQNGQWPDAAAEARKAIAPGTRDAHLLYHAGMILSRAGDLGKGGELLRGVAAVNPRYFNTFHVHR